MLYVSSLASIAAASARSPTAQFPLEPNTILTPSQSLTLDSIPLLGFGTSDLDTRNASEAVSWAIQVGYRHIDCDPAYKNQDLVGKGIADGLNKTGLRREDLWITSKLQSRQYVPQSLFLTTNPPSQQLTTSTPSYKTQKKVTQSLTTTLHDLQLSYLDLYHLPYAATSPHKPHHLQPSNPQLLATWSYMTTLIPLNLTHHIGLANFPPPALETLLNATSHPPATHQLTNLNPSSPQPDFLAFHQDRGIHVTASSPLTSSRISRRYNTAAQVLLETSVLARIARERGCSSPAQVALAWGLRRGTSVLPSGGEKGRIEEFFGAIECEILEEDLARVDALGFVGEAGLRV